NEVVLPGFRDRMHPVPEPGGMMAARLLKRPIDEILAIGEDERLCDSRTVDIRVRPFLVISECSKPAEWIYVMKCCGVRHWLAIRAMSSIYSLRLTRVTAHTARIRSATWPTARVPYIGCRGMAMRLDEVVGAIDAPPLWLAHLPVGIQPGS